MVAVFAMLPLTAVPAAAAPVTPHDAMPDLVGKTAFDANKAVPFGTRIVYVDGTGRHRKVVWPANWQVCKQDPAAGAQITSADTVTLTVVKREEKC
ncbi:hypothetical protein GCM10018954_063400 [Kutzneria kofuensis]